MTCNTVPSQSALSLYPGNDFFSVLLIHRLHQKPTKAIPLGLLPPFPQQTSTHTYTSTRTRLVRQKVTLRSSSIRLGLPSSHERSEKPTKKEDGIEEVRMKKKEEHQKENNNRQKKSYTRSLYVHFLCARFPAVCVISPACSNKQYQRVNVLSSQNETRQTRGGNSVAL
jgi:hypothetical protein